MTSPSSPRKKPPNAAFKYLGLAAQMMATLGLAMWGGHQVDRCLHLSFPWFLLSFSLLSLGVILWNIIKDTGHEK